MYPDSIPAEIKGIQVTLKTDGNASVLIKYIQTIINNNRLKVSEFTDNGSWSTTDGDFSSRCPRRQYDATGKLLTGYRQRNEILNAPGSHITFRSDDNTIWNFRKIRGLPEVKWEEMNQSRLD